MIQTAIIGLPALIALIVGVRRGPERALLNVYLPTLLLLPQFYHWPITGHLSFAETAIAPIAIFLIFRQRQRWQWSFADFLVIAYSAITTASEFVNKGYSLGQNLALHQLCSVLLPYFAVKETFYGEELMTEFAKRTAICLTIVAIVSIYELRMGSDLFLAGLMRFFPDFAPAPVVFRGGFMRVQGPYGHAILAGVMMAAGYRIVRWLDWSGKWAGRMPFIPVSKTRFCEFWMIAGSAMTISVGPWIGAAGGALAVSIFRARNRKAVVAAVVIVLGFMAAPLYSSVSAYLSVDPLAAGDRLQEDAAYRRKLMPLYIPIVEERPTWGWGRNAFPVLEGMPSVDNGYLFMALTFGLYALGAFVLALAGMPLRLCKFGVRRPYDDPAALLAFSLIGIYVVIALSIATAWLGGQTETTFFLITAWSDRLMSTHMPAMPATAADGFAFRRVMA